MKWGVAAASVIVVAGVAIAGTLTVQSAQARDRLAAAVALWDAADQTAAAAQSNLDAAMRDYSALAAQGADAVAAAAPVIAQLGGMSDETARLAAQATLDALTAQSAVDPVAEPAAYGAAEIDTTDLEALAAAADAAQAHGKELDAAASDVRDAAATFEGRIDDARAALFALGASLPSSADRIVAENPLPAAPLHDAVRAAAGAAAAATEEAAALEAMGTYAGAVAALRDEQTRIAAEQQRMRELQEQRSQTPRTPRTEDPVPAPAPAPQPAPGAEEPTVPEPAPQPEPQPQPEPEPEPPAEPNPGDEWPWPWPWPDES
ncbi:hypothetical protein JNB63_05130 [Microbacterium trichothecenolyticum]|uniref:hypothetical protein n=1 Tax=Microbacterium trichothecenolyticum TaxID=69370 RepID=UPI001C6EED50|nr:hypothetical protein [Microbacterium trichothecenolyticum]MBW9119471.1 hypothetical protein [Microbacterium trichothecenolyticum]